MLDSLLNDRAFQQSGQYEKEREREIERERERDRGSVNIPGRVRR